MLFIIYLKLQNFYKKFSETENLIHFKCKTYKLRKPQVKSKSMKINIHYKRIYY